MTLFKLYLVTLTAAFCGLHTAHAQESLRRTRCKGDTFPLLCRSFEYVHVNDVIMGRSSCDGKCCPLPLIDDCAAVANSNQSAGIYDIVRRACASSRRCTGLSLNNIECHEKSGAFLSHQVDYMSINYTCIRSPSTIKPAVTPGSGSGSSSKSRSTITIGSVASTIGGIIVIGACVYCWCRRRWAKSNTRVEVNHMNVTVAAPPIGHHYPHAGHPGYGQEYNHGAGFHGQTPGYGYPPPYDQKQKY